MNRLPLVFLISLLTAAFAGKAQTILHTADSSRLLIRVSDVTDGRRLSDYTLTLENDSDTLVYHER